ncbi:hypothetical protein Tsp_12714 [Trichinella spiralis]|nr:hypothetical protein Tsp_12714 [Trichinella spiralis]
MVLSPTPDWFVSTGLKRNRTLLATVGAHWIPPIPFTVTVSDVPTRFKALATSSVTRVVSAPLSNKQLTVSRCPFTPVAMAFTPRVLASNTRVVVSSLDSARAFFPGGVFVSSSPSGRGVCFFGADGVSRWWVLQPRCLNLHRSALCPFVRQMKHMLSCAAVALRCDHC